MPMGSYFLAPSMGPNHRWGVVIMSNLEERVKRMATKHQDVADHYHRVANKYKQMGYHKIAVEADKKAHSAESIALELRMVLRGQ